MKQKIFFLLIWCSALCVVQVLVTMYLKLETCDINANDPTKTLIYKSEKLYANHSSFLTKASTLNHTSVDFSNVKYCEPLVREDFSTVASKTPVIPHVIHQTYKDTNVPEQFVSYVQTLVQKNPNWTYYFWTDESARKFVADAYPKFLQVWDNYKKSINRADAIRYMVLYEFGGFYGDLDVSCKRPLDKLTTKYACIFPPEPFEQSVFRINIPYLLSNAIMLCRPKHPFLKHMIDSLHQYEPMLEQLDTAGPSFVTSQFIRYNNISADEIYKMKERNESNSPYFYKGGLPEDDVDAVYVPNTQYFINSLSQTWMNENDYVHICAEHGQKSTIETRACNEIHRRLAQKERSKFAYTDHHWYHTYSRASAVLRKSRPIWNIVTRNLKIYSVFPHNLEY